MSLERADRRRKARETIAAAIAEFGAGEKIIVIEDILADLYAAHGQSITPPRNGEATSLPAITTVVATNGDKNGLPQWRRILEYCATHPAPRGIYRAMDVGAALFSNLNTADNPYLASTAVHSAIRRHSTKYPKCSEPYFEALKKGKFRVLSEEERNTKTKKHEQK